MHKILFLPKWYPCAEDIQNGVFIQKHAQAAALHNEVTVLTVQTSENGREMEEMKAGNLNEVIVYYKPSLLKPLSILRYALAMRKGWRRVRQAGFFPDVCHVHVLNRPALLALWLKRKNSIPFIISEHWSGYVTGDFEHRGIVTGLFTALAVKQAAMVAVVSETLKAGMMQCGLKAAYRIVPNVAEALPDAWKQKPVTDKFRFLVVADLRDAVKNISGVIRAFKNVHAQEPQTELVIAGDGADKEKLEALSQALGLMESCYFKGRLSNEEVLRLIPTAHAILINSRIETFSVVALESIFSGRPVISTRCGGPEQFINTQNGILIEKDNEQQLSEAMLKLMKNYSGYPAEQVKNSIPDIYTMEAVARALDDCYDAVKVRV